MKEHGILYPIHVTSDNRIIDGNIRLQAALQLRYKEVHVVKHDVHNPIPLAMALNGFPQDVTASAINQYHDIYPEWTKLSEEDRAEHLYFNHTLQQIRNKHAGNRPKKPSVRKDFSPFIPYANMLPAYLQNRLKLALKYTLTEDQAALLLTLFNDNNDVRKPPLSIVIQMLDEPLLKKKS